MRIGLVVDATCDMPSNILEKYGIVILPLTIKIGEAVFADIRDEQSALAFIDSDIAQRGFDAETSSFSVDQIHDLFLKRLVIDYDYVFCLTMMKNRSPVFNNATQASFVILNDYKPIRTSAGHNTPFSLRVIDTQNLFAAQGVAMIEAAQMIAAGEQPPKIRARIDQLVPNIQGYLIVRDLHYMRARTRKKGEASVSLFSASLGSMLDIKPILHGNRGETGPVGKARGFDNAARKLFAYVVGRIRGGLLSPNVCMSYGGPVEEMRALPGYSALRDICLSQGVTLHESTMSLTGMVNLGKGALVIGFAAEGQLYKD
ncbi:MAG: DegV family protein [Pseudomonadota bacterium]